MPFEEIGPIVGRSAEAARQLASRARRRVRGGAATKIANGKITEIEVIGNPARLGELDVAIVD